LEELITPVPQGLKYKAASCSLERNILTSSPFLSTALSASFLWSILCYHVFSLQRTNPAHEKTYPKRLCSPTNSKQGQASGEFIFLFSPLPSPKKKVLNLALNFHPHRRLHFGMVSNSTQNPSHKMLHLAG
jgi:hypothetical protein